MWNKQENRNVNQGSQFCVSAGDIDDSTESANFENDSNIIDEYNSFVLELNKGTAPKSYCTDDCPETESFLHGSLVFVHAGVSENNAASEAPLGNAETDCDNIPKASNPDQKIRDASYFLRRRRSVVKRRFLVFVLITIFLSIGWTLTKMFTAHQERTFEATIILGTSDNGAGDSSEEKLTQIINDKVYISSHRDRSENKPFTKIFQPPRHIADTPIFVPPRHITDKKLGSTEAKVRKGKSHSH